MTREGSNGTDRWGLVIIHYRDEAAVRRLLAETRGWQNAPALAVVVDNSADFTSRVDERVVVVRPDRNLGYAGAANLGMDRVAAALPEATRVLLCTQDASLEPGTTAGLHATMDRNPRCAVAAPLLAYGTRPAVVFSMGGRLSRGGYGSHPRQGVPRTAVSGDVAVDWVDGAITLLDLEAVRAVGGFDPAYFLYVEEIDLQTRLRLAGRTVVMNRDVVGYQEPGTLPTYLKYRNGVYFTRKLRPALSRWPVGRQLLRDTARRAAGRSGFSPVWALRGVLDARRGRMGPPPARAMAGRGGPS